MSVHFSSSSDEWATPKNVYKILDDEFHFDYDPCPLGGKGGLESDWGKVTFCNPPYSQIKHWVCKAWEESQKGKIVVLLIPSRTDTRWWHDYVMRGKIRFIKGRLIFGTDEYWSWVWEQEFINGKKNSLYKKYGKKNSAPFPSAIVVFKKESL